MTYIFEELHKIRLKENYAQDLDLAQKNMARLSQKETGQDKKDYQSVARALNQGNLGAVKKVIKGISTDEIRADILNVLVGYNDLIAKMYPKAVDSKGRLKTPMNVGTLIKEDEKIIEEKTDFDELAELVENIQKVIKLFPGDNDWKKLITKHRRDIDALRRGKDLPQKVQDELMSWAMDNGEIKTDDVDELDDFIMTIIDA